MKSKPRTNHIAIINKFFSENNIQPNEDGYEKMRLYVSGKNYVKNMIKLHMENGLDITMIYSDLEEINLNV